MDISRLDREVTRIRRSHKARMDEREEREFPGQKDKKKVIDRDRRRAKIKLKRGDAREPEAWITLENGAHVPLGEGGKAIGGAGGWAKGKVFSHAKSEKKKKASAGNEKTVAVRGENTGSGKLSSKAAGIAGKPGDTDVIAGGPMEGMKKLQSLRHKGTYYTRVSNKKIRRTPTAPAAKEQHEPYHGKPGEVVTGKGGKLRAKSEASKRIDTADALREFKEDKIHNSLEAHIDENGNLSAERQALHDAIIRDFFKDKVTYKGGKPTLVMSGGGPASGKSFIQKEANAEYGGDATITVDPDEIKKLLPGYRDMCLKTDKAAGYYHEESSALAKRIYQYAVDNGINVVYDGTGDGSENSVMKKIKVAQEEGYEVRARYVSVGIQEAINRNLSRYEHAVDMFNESRSDDTPRLPNEEIVITTHEKVSDISIAVANMFDSFELYDNNGPTGSKPVKIATSTKGGDIIAEPGCEKMLQDYLDKGYSGATVVNGKVVRKNERGDAMNGRKYEGWTSREWNLMVYSLNDELPPEKCKVKLTEEEKEGYLKDLRFLQEERRKNPGVPIGYSPVEKDW